jgi:Tol biopolymer transport system component
MWTIAVDGSLWSETFDNIWDPVFSPAGDKVAAKAERNGRYYIVVNGNVSKKGYESLWNPVFSPDGNKVLVRCVDNGKYYRRIVHVSEL